MPELSFREDSRTTSSESRTGCDCRMASVMGQTVSPALPPSPCTAVLALCAPDGLEPGFLQRKPGDNEVIKVSPNLTQLVPS